MIVAIWKTIVTPFEKQPLQVKIKISKESQEYNTLCKWKAKAYYRVGWFGFFKCAGHFASAEGVDRYRERYNFKSDGLALGGCWKDSYYDLLMPAAYKTCVKHVKNNGKPYLKEFDIIPFLIEVDN